MLVREEIDENSTVYIDAAPNGKDLVYQVEKDGGLVNAATRRKSDILIQIPNDAKSDAPQLVKKMKIEIEEVGLSMARRLAQGQSIKIQLYAALPVQIDGALAVVLCDTGGAFYGSKTCPRAVN
ncbi:hypothetical protein RHSIM_RhsimUnG0229400 [Rhododendron simsii]|uniref:Uncharacterized protein n=1 Tax=Rhododendron simsii TaxID=118357 RepID=A0A834FUF9_RHOSS|nr:hypothetical protein RHSIM_RhsimUnG0229400 [Rhododendron simsii]